MSEVAGQAVEGQEEGKAGSKDAVSDATNLVSRLENVEGLNQRLLDEGRRNKARAQHAEKKLVEFQERQNAVAKEKAEAEGNWKNLYETERKHRENLEKDLGDFQNFVTKREVETALRTAALKARAHEPSDVVRMIDFSRVDADEKGNVLNADNLVAEIKGNKPYMFSEQSLPSHIEGGQPPAKPPPAVELGAQEISKLVRSSDTKEKERGLAFMKQMEAAEGRI